MLSNILCNLKGQCEQLLCRQVLQVFRFTIQPNNLDSLLLCHTQMCSACKIIMFQMIVVTCTFLQQMQHVFLYMLSPLLLMEMKNQLILTFIPCLSGSTAICLIVSHAETAEEVILPGARRSRKTSKHISYTGECCFHQRKYILAATQSTHEDSTII